MPWTLSLTAFRWRLAFGGGVVVSHRVMGGVLVAHRLHQLGVVFGDLVKRGGDLGRHVAAHLSVGRVFAAFGVQHFLCVSGLGQLRFNRLDLLDDAWGARVLVANDHHFSLNALDLIAEQLRFRLRDLRPDHRRLGRVSLDTLRVVPGVLDVAGSSLVCPKSATWVLPSFDWRSNFALCQDGLRNKGGGGEHDCQTEHQFTDVFRGHLFSFSRRGGNSSLRSFPQSGNWMLARFGFFTKFPQNCDGKGVRSHTSSELRSTHNVTETLFE